MNRSISDTIKESKFLQEYANNPVERFDEATAVKNLQRLGILTKNKHISAKYYSVLVKNAYAGR